MKNYPYHRGDQVLLKKDGSLHVVAHVYKRTRMLLFEDFLTCFYPEATMIKKKPLFGFFSLAYTPPRFVANEDLCEYLPPQPFQLRLF